MSTGYECEIAELSPGQWYYVLQDWDCPRGAWDWREHASVVGPYPSADAAVDGLQRNEANPGGYSEVPYPTDMDARTCATRLVARARRPRR